MSDEQTIARLAGKVAELTEALAKIARGGFNCSPHQYFMAAQAIAEDALAHPKARNERHE